MKKELVEKLAELIPDELTQEQEKAVRLHFENALRDAPRCNKCGGFFNPGWGTISVDVSWGYNSTGKDTDRDKWKLCQDCSKEFETRYDPICCLCKLSVVEVMAELYSRNPHCTFYGDYKGALRHYRTNEHCGFEYATVAGRIVCEICYEKFIETFKIPIKAGSYRILTGDFLQGEGAQRKNRIEQQFAFKPAGDAVSVFSETWFEFDEVVAIRILDDAAHRAIKLTFRESKPDMLAIHLKSDPTYEDTAILQTGTGEYIRIPLSYLEEKAKQNEVQLDMAKPDIHAQGQFISFGDLKLSTAAVIDWVAKQ